MVVCKKKLIFLKWGLFIVCIFLISFSVCGVESVEIENTDVIEEGDELIYCPEAGGICFVGDMGYGGISMPPKD
ncbi:hypothetical protein [Odoribacter sp. Z80]|uniref:hypothetical protein n=1 Tax=Odoribacter sp. Z80 TaxID=2304575 RepID=UPI00137980D7|nr:hypothetical protein [Odoribacter sp. Z80]NCE73003.1 hypothetical protein [Odoribacter sp. Z80]